MSAINHFKGICIKKRVITCYLFSILTISLLQAQDGNYFILYKDTLKYYDPITEKFLLAGIHVKAIDTTKYYFKNLLDFSISEFKTDRHFNFNNPVGSKINGQEPLLFRFDLNKEDKLDIVAISSEQAENKSETSPTNYYRLINFYKVEDKKEVFLNNLLSSYKKYEEEIKVFHTDKIDANIYFLYTNKDHLLKLWDTESLNVNSFQIVGKIEHSLSKKLFEALLMEISKRYKVKKADKAFQIKLKDDVIKLDTDDSLEVVSVEFENDKFNTLLAHNPNSNSIYSLKIEGLNDVKIDLVKKKDLLYAIFKQFHSVRDIITVSYQGNKYFVYNQESIYIWEAKSLNNLGKVKKPGAKKLWDDFLYNISQIYTKHNDLKITGDTLIGDSLRYQDNELYGEFIAVKLKYDKSEYPYFSTYTLSKNSSKTLFHRIKNIDSYYQNQPFLSSLFSTLEEEYQASDSIVILFDQNKDNHFAYKNPDFYVWNQSRYNKNLNKLGKINWPTYTDPIFTSFILHTDALLKSNDYGWNLLFIDTLTIRDQYFHVIALLYKTSAEAKFYHVLIDSLEQSEAKSASQYSLSKPSTAKYGIKKFDKVNLHAIKGYLNFTKYYLKELYATDDLNKVKIDSVDVSRKKFLSIYTLNSKNNKNALAIYNPQSAKFEHRLLEDSIYNTLTSLKKPNIRLQFYSTFYNKNLLFYGLGEEGFGGYSRFDNGYYYYIPEYENKVRFRNASSAYRCTSYILCKNKKNIQDIETWVKRVLYFASTKYSANSQMGWWASNLAFQEDPLQVIFQLEPGKCHCR